MIRVQARASRRRGEPGGAVFEVWCAPGASRDLVRGEHGGRLKVALAAPAERGRANEALLRLLARALGVRRSDLVLERGRAGRAKRVLVRSLEAGALGERLARLVGGGSSGGEGRRT